MLYVPITSPRKPFVFEEVINTHKLKDQEELNQLKRFNEIAIQKKREEDLLALEAIRESHASALRTQRQVEQIEIEIKRLELDQKRMGVEMQALELQRITERDSNDLHLYLLNLDLAKSGVTVKYCYRAPYSMW
jgi:hypothetical protein